MSEKRFTIKPQDDYWAVVDNHNEDKVCIINGIHTEIEAIWLCDFMNEQQDTINILLEELINAQNQGYVVDFLHKNGRCNLTPKELDDE